MNGRTDGHALGRTNRCELVAVYPRRPTVDGGNLDGDPSRGTNRCELVAKKSGPFRTQNPSENDLATQIKTHFGLFDRARTNERTGRFDRPRGRLGGIERGNEATTYMLVVAAARSWQVVYLRVEHQPIGDCPGTCRIHKREQHGHFIGHDKSK